MALGQQRAAAPNAAAWTVRRRWQPGSPVCVGPPACARKHAPVACMHTKLRRRALYLVGGIGQDCGGVARSCGGRLEANDEDVIGRQEGKAQVACGRLAGGKTGTSMGEMAGSVWEVQFK